VPELGNGHGDGPIQVLPVVVLSQTFPARPSWIPEIRDFVRRCLAESPLTEDGNREVGETVFRALLDAAGPTGAIQVSFRIFPEHVEVDVLHSNQPPEEVANRNVAVAPRAVAASAGPASPPATAPAPAASTSGGRPATFADWMSSTLRREGLTQEAAARQLGVSVKTVGRWVGGETEPRLRDLRRIQELFGELPFP
jgi:DNA-binding XRE family transcriptional regulator